MHGFGFEALEIKILCQVYGLVKGPEASDRDGCEVHAKGLISSHFLSMIHVLYNHRAYRHPYQTGLLREILVSLVYL
jgi:hypothetical protein